MKSEELELIFDERNDLLLDMAVTLRGIERLLAVQAGTPHFKRVDGTDMGLGPLGKGEITR